MKVTFHFLSGKEETLDDINTGDVDSMYNYMKSGTAFWVKSNGRKVMFSPNRIDYVVVEE
jgi:hypothetical protein